MAPLCHPCVHGHETRLQDRHTVCAHVCACASPPPSQEAIDICRSRSDNATEACKLLIRTASEIWAREEGETRDDISAIVVFLPVIEKVRTLSV